MPTDSISDALDAPFGVDEIRPVREIVTVITGTRNSLTGFLASIRNLLSVSETDSGADPAVDLIQTKGQRKIGVVMKDTDLSTLKM